MSKSHVSIGSQWLRRILRLQVSAGRPTDVHQGLVWI